MVQVQATFAGGLAEHLQAAGGANASIAASLRESVGQISSATDRLTTQVKISSACVSAFCCQSRRLIHGPVRLPASGKEAWLRRGMTYLLPRAGGGGSAAPPEAGGRDCRCALETPSKTFLSQPEPLLGVVTAIVCYNAPHWSLGRANSSGDFMSRRWDSTMHVQAASRRCRP